MIISHFHVEYEDEAYTLFYDTIPLFSAMEIEELKESIQDFQKELNELDIDVLFKKFFI